MTIEELVHLMGQTSFEARNSAAGQMLKQPFAGADRGLQIGTAMEKEGSLSGCTFSESLTWGKYHSANSRKLVQIWGEYSIVFPLLAAYVIDRCEARERRRLVSRIPEFVAALEQA
jgi:deoxyhypusine synthase